MFQSVKYSRNFKFNLSCAVMTKIRDELKELDIYYCDFFDV